LASYYLPLNVALGFNRMPKNIRPTIPISEWRIATHLEATKALQNQSGTPAYNCQCEWCQIWAECSSHILPAELKSQLERFGIEPTDPTDLYRFDSSAESVSIRIVYHAVGKILSGPACWSEHPEVGAMLQYKELRKSPYLSMVVLVQKDSVDQSSPEHHSTGHGDLIRLDFRLEIPENKQRKPNKSKQ
jgi:hypothetical protein